jgi:hypothetical protein
MASEKKEGWINIYPPAPGSIRVAYGSDVYRNEEEARINAKNTAVARIKISWEE